MPRAAVAAFALALLALAPTAAAQSLPVALNLYPPIGADFGPDGSLSGGVVRVSYCHHPAGGVTTSPTRVTLRVETTAPGVGAMPDPANIEFRPVILPDENGGHCAPDQSITIRSSMSFTYTGDVLFTVRADADANGFLENASTETMFLISGVPERPIFTARIADATAATAPTEAPGRVVDVWLLIVLFGAVAGVAIGIGQRRRRLKGGWR